MKNLPTPVTVENLIQEFNEHERKAFEKISEKMRSIAKDEIRGRFELAKTIAEVCEDMQKNKTYYRSNFLERAAICLGFKSALPLREMLKVAQRWPTWEDLEREVITIIPQHLRWKDIVFLSKAKNEEEYTAVLNDILAQQPTAVVATRLNQPENLDEDNASVVTQRGRKPKAPDTLEALLEDILRTSRQIQRKAAMAWVTFPLHQSITGILKDDERIEPTWKLLKNAYIKLTIAIEKLNQLKESLQDEAERFSAYVNDDLPNVIDVTSVDLEISETESEGESYDDIPTE
ncbi:MAG: hypothetical protein ACPL1K_02280 [Candidatus Kryptoniota bacterium]